MELVDERPMLSCFSFMLQTALHHLGLERLYLTYNIDSDTRTSDVIDDRCSVFLTSWSRIPCEWSYTKGYKPMTVTRWTVKPKHQVQCKGHLSVYMSDNAGEIQCFSVWPLRGLVDLKALFSAKSAQEKFTEVPVNFWAQSYLAASQVPLFCPCSYFVKENKTGSVLQI